MAGLVHHVDLVHDRIDRLVAGVLLDGLLDVPLADLAVQEQRGVSVATAIEGRVQRPQAHFGLGHDGLVRIVQLAVEPVQHLLQLDDGAGGRELARADEVLAVRRGVHAVRVLRYRHAAHQRRLRILVELDATLDHRHLGVADGGELAFLHGLLDAGHVEEEARIPLVRHHVGVVLTFFQVVLVGGSQLAVERGGDQVAVAVDARLPLHFHRQRVHAGEECAVLAGVLDVLAVIGQRHAEFLAAEHARGVVDGRVDRVALVGEDAVEALDVRDLGDLVAHHVVQAEAGQTCVDLVVHPAVFAVVDAVLVGGLDVVSVAHGVLQRAIGVGAHDGLGFVGDAPARQVVGHEAGHARQLAAGRDAQDACVTRVAAAPEAIVGVELARLDFGGAGAAYMSVMLGCCACGCASGISRCVLGAVFLASGQRHTADAQGRGGVQEAPSADSGGFFFPMGILGFETHAVLSLRQTVF